MFFGLFGDDEQTADNPPKGECRQCWAHAYAKKREHGHLAYREDCPACMNHLNNGHGGQIVQ